jgi:hypothetical protein
VVTEESFTLSDAWRADEHLCSVGPQIVNAATSSATGLDSENPQQWPDGAPVAMSDYHAVLLKRAWVSGAQEWASGEGSAAREFGVVAGYSESDVAPWLRS